MNDTHMPLVSIIIPVYKVELYIEDCIQSVIDQTYENLDIILVDDCGGDASVSIAESLLASSARKWRVIRHDTNRGLSAARNTGVEYAMGQYIYFLDSDDYIAPSCISIMCEAALRYKVPIIVGCGVVLLMPDGTVEPIWKDNSVDLYEQDPFRAFLRLEHNYTAWHRLIDLDSYKRCGVSFREGILHEDVIWSYQLARTGLRICSAPGSCLYYYRQREDSIMSMDVNNPRRYYAHLETMRLFYKDLVEEEWNRDSDFRNRYATLFHEAINRIMKRKELSMRQRCKSVKSLLQEFNHIIPEIQTTYLRMKKFVKLSRCMPACIAYHLAALL